MVFSYQRELPEAGVAQGTVTGHAASQSLRFARAKFRPTALPTTLVIRPALHDQLTAGATYVCSRTRVTPRDLVV